MEVYARVRRAIQVDGMSSAGGGAAVWAGAQDHPEDVGVFDPAGLRAMKKPVVKPKLGPWLGIIDQILEDDKSQPKKQRHTAKRIWERALKSEHAFTGG